MFLFQQEIILTIDLSNSKQYFYMETQPYEKTKNIFYDRLRGLKVGDLLIEDWQEDFRQI